MRFPLLVVVLMAILLPVLPQSIEPKGWSDLVEAIEKTNFTDVSTLRDRAFDLIVPGARKEDVLTVEPANAFKVDHPSPDRFKVTIVNPSALVYESAPGVQEYHPFKWGLNTGGEKKLTPAFEGRASCRYHVRFRQTGGNEIDLSRFDDSYEVTWEVSNPPAIASVERDGSGLSVIRSADSTSEASIRLRIKKKTGTFDIRTDWIAIQLCQSPRPAITPEVVRPPEQPPEVVRPPETPPERCFQVKTVPVGTCDVECAGIRITNHVTVTNTCNRQVRCNDMTWSLLYGENTAAQYATWVELAGGTNTSFYVVLQAPVKSFPFSVSSSNGSCFYR